MNLVEVQNLEPYFFTEGGYVKTVDDVSFTIRKGDVVGLAG